MNKAVVLYILGWILLFEAALLTLPLVTAFIYGEQNSALAFIITILISAAVGALLVIKKPKDRSVYMREGLVITGLSWIVISIIGSLPFIISGAIPDPIEALFETVSGFTTTGASILSDVESLDKCLILWRSFTHWIGGMGVLVFILMLKPLTGGSTVNLMKAESPGPQVEKLVPHLHSTAQILYGIYVAMTIIQFVLLLIADMPVFDALNTAFATAGTGGFGIKNDSMGSYSTLQQGIVTIFMILFGVNFTAYYMILLGRFKKATAMEEVRWYFGIILVSILIIAFNIRSDFASFWASLHHSAFQVGSIITTTGYSTVDFNTWPAISKTILVVLMFIGACAGSTGGGIKVSRIIILFKSVKKEIGLFLHPQRVSKAMMDEKPIPHNVMRSTNVYMATYILIFAVSVLLISLDNFDLTTNFTAVATTLNNVGPGLEAVGPTQNFGVMSGFSKLVMIFDMLAGRLELFPILLLFKNETWRKF